MSWRRLGSLDLTHEGASEFLLDLLAVVLHMNLIDGN